MNELTAELRLLEDGRHVEYSIRNVSPGPLRLREMADDLRITRDDGRSAFYCVFNFRSPPDEVVQLPGEAMTATVDLLTGYMFPVPGEYTVRLAYRSTRWARGEVPLRGLDDVAVDSDGVRFVVRPEQAGRTGGVGGGPA